MTGRGSLWGARAACSRARSLQHISLCALLPLCAACMSFMSKLSERPVLRCLVRPMQAYKQITTETDTSAPDYIIRATAAATAVAERMVSERDSLRCMIGMGRWHRCLHLLPPCFGCTGGRTVVTSRALFAWWAGGPSNVFATPSAGTCGAGPHHGASRRHPPSRQQPTRPQRLQRERRR